MKKTYVLKPKKPNEILARIDRQKRDKVEGVLGKPLSDAAWLDYKKMVKGIK